MARHLSLLLAAALVAAASASCPNACSGHGTCNQYSACECYRNWMGADCAQRQCAWAHSFVDLPQGDLNADGRVDIPNLYSVSLCSDKSFFTDQATPASCKASTGLADANCDALAAVADKTMCETTTTPADTTAGVTCVYTAPFTFASAADAFVSQNKDQTGGGAANGNDAPVLQGTSLRIHNQEAGVVCGYDADNSPSSAGLGGDCTGDDRWGMMGFQILENVNPSDQYTASNDPHGVVEKCRERMNTLTYAIVVHVKADKAPPALCEPNEWLRDDGALAGAGRFAPCVDIVAAAACTNDESCDSHNNSPDLLRKATLNVRTATSNGLATDVDGGARAGVFFAIRNGEGDPANERCAVVLGSEEAEATTATECAFDNEASTDHNFCVRSAASMTGSCLNHPEPGRALYVGAVGSMTYPTQQTNAALWERYPADHGHAREVQGYSTATATAGNTAVAKDAWDEAHFYAECSSKGLCDRSTGLCQCFPGFEGDGCTRTACPNDCSGHGTCDRLVDSDAAYAAWDAYKTQRCACDAGYTGPNCALRECPRGDDPISRHHTGSNLQTHNDGLGHTGHRTSSAEVQVIGLANYGSLLTGRGRKGTRSAPFALEFTDMYGDKWTTETVNFRHDHGRSQAIVAADIEAALENLPNNVLSNVEVSAFAMTAPAQIVCEINVSASNARATTTEAGDGLAGKTLFHGGRAVNCRFADGATSGAGIPNAQYLSSSSIAFETVQDEVDAVASQLACLPAGANAVVENTNGFPALDALMATTDVVPVVEGGHLVGLDVCPGGTLGFADSTSAGLDTADEAKLGSAVWRITVTYAVRDTGVASLYGITFVDNAGDIPTLGARFNWQLDTLTANDGSVEATAPFSTCTTDDVTDEVDDAGKGAMGFAYCGDSIQKGFGEDGSPFNECRSATGFVCSSVAWGHTDCSAANGCREGASGNCEDACANRAVCSTYNSGVGCSSARPTCTGHADCVAVAAPNAATCTTAVNALCVFADGEAPALNCGTTQNAADGSFPPATLGLCDDKPMSSFYVIESFKGDKEQDVCSNRGICDYSTGLCKCFAGFTKDDCSVQNSLSAA